MNVELINPSAVLALLAGTRDTRRRGRRPSRLWSWLARRPAR